MFAYLDRVRRAVRTRLDRTVIEQYSPLAPPPSPDVSNGPYLEMLQSFISEIDARDASLLELGSRARSGNSYREMFPASIQHFGVDITPGENVDAVGDAHQLSSFLNRTFDAAFSISAFEHFIMPWKVVLELNAVLKVGAPVFVQSHQTWPLHDEPWDYFRFSKYGWQGLFNSHTGFEIVRAEHRLPGRICAVTSDELTTQGLESQPAFLVSGCVARKTAPPLVAWRAEMGAVMDIQYLH